MTSTLPTIVLVHGAWHTPQNYARYIKALQAQGFTVHSPRLPTCSGTTPYNTFADDVATVRNTVSELVESGQKVLMVMHSYGGIVGTDAVEGLSLSERKGNGLAGGVIHLVYLCAYILQPGKTVFGIVEDTGVAELWPQFIDDAPDGSIFPRDPAVSFLGGMEEEKEVVDEALSCLVRFPMAALKTPVAGSAWRKIPGTYVKTEQDYAVLGTFQDLMLERVRGEGVELKIEEFDTNHSVFLTRTEDMVRVVLGAVGDGRNGV